jgi:hypothetical protein
MFLFNVKPKIAFATKSTAPFLVMFGKHRYKKSTNGFEAASCENKSERIFDLLA